MEFCQIQLNYLDWDFQNARDKVAVLNERNIPIIVMEPLRGGNLVALEEEDAALLEPLRPGVSTVDWAFRYLQGIDGISVILSGMSSLAQLQDNVEIFGKEIILDEAQTQALHDIAAKMIARVALPCTKCRYCVSYCPQGLDIPWLIELFNEHNSRDEGKFIAPMALAAMPADKHPAACIGCGSCQRVCPQKLPIPDALSVFAYMLG